MEHERSGAEGIVGGQVQALLDAMEGIAYVVGGNGRVLACGRRSWSKFAVANGGAGIADPQSVIGRHILDFVDGDDVIAAYRDYMSGLLTGAVEAIAFGFRCDAPGVRRDLWMTIRPIETDGHASALLFQSITLNELSRPPISLFDHEAFRTQMESRKSKPIVTLCAYCADVAMPPDGNGRRSWVSPETYYRIGGDPDVRLSHGICPACHDRYVAGVLAG